MSFIENLPNTYVKLAYAFFALAKVFGGIAVCCIFGASFQYGAIAISIYALTICLSITFGIMGAYKSLFTEEILLNDKSV